MEFNPYTQQHIIDTMQLMLFTALGFFLLLRYLEPENTITLDVDYIYRKFGKWFLWFCKYPMMRFADIVDRKSIKVANTFLWFTRNPISAMKIIRDSIIIIFLKHKRVELKTRLRMQRLRHLSRHEQIGISMGILLFVIILLIYLLIYVY